MSGDAFLGHRSDYNVGSLTREQLLDDPIAQLRRWLDDALAAKILEPMAMSLATVSENGRPSSRMVLLRGVDERGLRFFTNYESRKGRELSVMNHACVNFWWGDLERQVRVEGTVERLSAGESDAYFESRPLESQIASMVSPQSREIDSREELEAALEELKSTIGDRAQKPENWGGYLLRPDYFEFWQGRKARLHDRFAYTPTDSSWRIARLAP